MWRSVDIVLSDVSGELRLTKYLHAATSQKTAFFFFERKILRKNFGPSKENDSWRMKTDQELNQLINFTCAQNSRGLAK
jgi:hypothetical protein